MGSQYTSSPTASSCSSTVSPFVETKKTKSSKSHHGVKVSLCLALCILISSSVFAFLLGCAARIRMQIMELPVLHDVEVVGANNSAVNLLISEGRQEQVDLLPRKHRNAGKRRQHQFEDPACHEVLVHPGMTTHSNPKRIAVVNQEFGALREVLKHRTVNQVDMFFANQEEEPVNSKTLRGPQVTIRRSDLLLKSNNVEQLFDVIIMSSPDNFSQDTSNIEALYNALADDGVLVLKIDTRSQKKSVQFINELVEIGFMSIHAYEDGHCDLVQPRSILVAFKDYKTRSKWHRNEAELQRQLHKRLQKPTSGKPPLIYADASTLRHYQVPSKASETTYCQDDEGEECDYRFQSLPADSVNIPPSQLAVRKSPISEMAGRGLFAAVDIPRHAVLALERTVQHFFVMPSSWRVINSIYEKRSIMRLENKPFEGLVYYILGYGYGSQLLGETQWTVDSWFSLFSNHGCNATYNFGVDYAPWSEESVSLDTIPDGLDGNLADPYSPFQERHLRTYTGGGDYILRDLKAGEEILTNYLSYVDPSEWKQSVLELRSECAGESAGEVTNYETGDKNYFG